jgi:hypothetical protein
MNRLNRIVYLLLVVLAATACGRGEHRFRHSNSATETITRSWPAADIRQLEVFEVSGSVSIEAANVSEITLIATARGDLELQPQAENKGLFESKIEGDTLRIGRKERNRKGFDFPILFDRDDVKIDYKLTIPAAVSLDLATVNGRITTRGTEGQTEASTVNGTIDLETSGAQTLSASSVNGRVKAKFLRTFQGAKFKSVNGGVEAILPNDASFSVDLSQVNGDFEASFPLSIHSNPGSRRVSGEVNGGAHELKIVTVNGDVELARLNDSL